MSDAEAYLQELRSALPVWCRRRFVAEVREHFASAITAEAERGVAHDEAERMTIERLGPAQALADQLLDDLRSGALGRVGRLGISLTTRRMVTTASVVAVTVLVGVALVGVRSSAAPPGLRRTAASNALDAVGASYAWGRESPATGFDSSGLVVWAYSSAGARPLPHNARALWRLGSRVPRSHLEPGDLVFFNDRELVGVYVGNGRFVDAEHSGAGVRLHLLAAQSSLHYDGAIRLDL